MSHLTKKQPKYSLNDAATYAKKRTADTTTDDLHDALLDPASYPYGPETLQALVDREMTVRAKWCADLAYNGRRMKEEGHYSEHQPCRYLAAEALPAALEGVMAVLNRLNTNMATRDKQHIELLSQLPWLQFTLIAFTNMVDAAVKRENIATAIDRIAGACETEAAWEHYAEREQKFFNVLLEQQHKSGKNIEHINNVLTVAMNRKADGLYNKDKNDHTQHPEIRWQNWPKGKEGFSRWLGNMFIDVICETTGLFTTELDMYNGKSKGSIKRLTTTKVFDDFVANTENRIGLYGGYYLPIPVPPRDWTDTQTGGYWTRYVGQKKLIKNWSRGYQEEMLNYTEQLSETVFPAINAAQHTAWRINRPVYDVLRTLAGSKNPIAGLPPVEDPKLPVCPNCGQPVGEDHACFRDPQTKKKEAYAKKLKKEGLDAASVKNAVETKFGGNKNEHL